MTDRQKKAIIYVGLFGLCFLFIWFASLIYTDHDKKEKVKNSIETEVFVNKPIMQDGIIVD